jgi:hypothetical protein
VLDGRDVLEVLEVHVVVKVKFYVNRTFTGQWEHSVPPDILLFCIFAVTRLEGSGFLAVLAFSPKITNKSRDPRFRPTSPASSFAAQSLRFFATVRFSPVTASTYETPVYLGFWRTGRGNSCANLSAVCRHVDIHSCLSTRGPPYCRRADC